jgi:hypothetical protein
MSYNIDEIVKIANNLWNDIKKRIKENPDFIKLTDAEKLSIYQNTDFKEFYNEMPIVGRYMICMGQYSAKALKRYLNKCKDVKHDPTVSRKPGYVEDQWVQRQADYVRYLWEAYQKHHYDKKDSNAIWKHAYETLKKEFSDFKTLHKDIEEKLQVENKSNKESLVKEMLGRIASKEQSLDDETTKELLRLLQDKVYRQRKSIIMNDIRTNVPLYE